VSHSAEENINVPILKLCDLTPSQFDTIATALSDSDVVRAIRQVKAREEGHCCPWRSETPATDSSEIWCVWLCPPSDPTWHAKHGGRREGGVRWGDGWSCTLACFFHFLVPSTRL